MPPHKFYGELFAGAGYIFKIKRPAAYNLAIDLDRNIIQKISPLGTGPEIWGWPNGPIFETRCCDAIEFLENGLNQNIIEQDKVLLYIDPPYLPSTLSRPKNSVRNGQRYDYKFGVEAHQRLIELITPLKCYVMISGYASAMYDRALCAPTWTRKTFMAATRRGMREECIWMNFNPDLIAERHDYRFIGDTFRERERIQKMQRRWVTKFGKLSPVEQRAMLKHLQSSLKIA